MNRSKGLSFLPCPDNEVEKSAYGNHSSHRAFNRLKYLGLDNCPDSTTANILAYIIPSGTAGIVFECTLVPESQVSGVECIMLKSIQRAQKSR